MAIFWPNCRTNLIVKRLLRLPGYLYKWTILLEIRGLIGRGSKLDMNTNNKVRRRFARMAIYVNLDKPLVSQVLISGKIQKINYEFLPKVCFHCGHYGHLKEVFPEKSTVSSMAKETTASKSTKMVVVTMREEHQSFGPWILVKRKSRQKSRDLPKKCARILAKNTGSSRFRALNSTASN
ncbi:hypothetical protein CXB51_024184 [Gossypium anomalum]|uniref:Zinc knuckle CX2CX4HX4C domain-containing protein n=1 Tax=Gossypium anomalum TaxID=47600 RepID=A0A8J5YIV3_9ROSI|nr:hypothetical protein CXB51_024184 [Gossypium anomalum]